MPPRGIPKSFTPPLDLTVSSISVTTFVAGGLAFDFIGILPELLSGSYFLDVNLLVTKGMATLGPMTESTNPVASERMTSRIRTISGALVFNFISRYTQNYFPRDSYSSTRYTFTESLLRSC